MPLNDIQNPLAAVRIGSPVSAFTGKFSPSIIIEKEQQITQMIPTKDVITSMTGQSAYVYTDQLNQGSFGLHGSYGIDGLAKLELALSTYFGNASATEVKSVNINYNVQMLSGIEYINFDDLTAEEIVLSLKKGPKARLTEVLEKFTAAYELIQGEKQDSLELWKKGRFRDETAEALQEWLKAMQSFVGEYGEGIVVGIIWGGAGSVSLKIVDKKSENVWKYGGQGKFDYAGLSTAVSIGSAYDGGQSDRRSDVTVECSSWASGACVADQVANWFDIVNNKAFNEIANIDLLEKAPKPEAVKDPPKLPDFIAPKDEESEKEALAKEMKKISGNLDLYSKVAQYQKERKNNPELTIPDFLRKLEDLENKNSQEKAVKELQQKVKENALPVDPEEKKMLKSVPDLISVDDSDLRTQAVEPDAERLGASDASEKGDYTVLGVWIANWSDIFPWMATGYFNGISDMKELEEILKVQIMIQDLLTLARIYFTLDSCKLDLSYCGIKSSEAVANAMAQQAHYLRLNMDMKNVVAKAFEELCKCNEAKVIYKKWDEIKFLRGAELGLGLLYNGKNSVTPDVIDKQFRPYPQTTYKSDYCSFGSGNFSAFSRFLKLMPFIGGNGKLYAFGPSNMLLKRSVDGKVAFTKRASMAMELTEDTDKKILQNIYREDIGGQKFVEHKTSLYPIPFSAAKGSKGWKGQIVSTNISAIPSINKRLEILIDQLKNQNIYTFSSDNWDKSWSSHRSYSLRSIRTQYFGLVPETASVFQSSPI